MTTNPTTPEAAERAQLKPCPFCGGEARRFDISTADELDPNAGGSGIECVSCSASTALHFDRKENLEDSWNRRAALAAQEGGGGEHDGYKEAAIAWAVCASIHREYAKGRDPLYTTRQADYMKAHEAARTKAMRATQEGTGNG